MICPRCGRGTRTVDSRPFAGTRYRKRKCEQGHIFWTSEEEADMTEVREMLAYIKSETRKKSK